MTDFNRLLGEVEEKRAFILPNGAKVKSLAELASRLRYMDDSVYHMHTNPENNNFANWISGSLGDDLLAQRITKLQDKKEFIKEIEDRIQQAKLSLQAKKDVGEEVKTDAPPKEEGGLEEEVDEDEDLEEDEDLDDEDTDKDEDLDEDESAEDEDDEMDEDTDDDMEDEDDFEEEDDKDLDDSEEDDYNEGDDKDEDEDLDEDESAEDEDDEMDEDTDDDMEDEDDKDEDGDLEKTLEDDKELKGDVDTKKETDESAEEDKEKILDKLDEVKQTPKAPAQLPKQEPITEPAEQQQPIQQEQQPMPAEDVQTEEVQPPQQVQPPKKEAAVQPPQQPQPSLPLKQPAQQPKATPQPKEEPKTVSAHIKPLEESDVKPIDILNISNEEFYKSIGININEEFIAELSAVDKVKIKKKKHLKTGVPGFDELVDKGIPQGTSILVSGGPGSGKTTFCIQQLGWAAERGEKCLFISLEEKEERLIEHMKGFGLNPEKYIKNETLKIKKLDSFKLSRAVEALLAHARGELMIDVAPVLDIIPENYKPKRVVLDSLSSISAAFAGKPEEYRVYVEQLFNIFNMLGVTSFIITEIQGVETRGHGGIEEFLADGVINFYNIKKGALRQPALEILKMRGVNHKRKIVPFNYAPGLGIEVYPLEEVFHGDE